jgi:hypothetical protein
MLVSDLLVRQVERCRLEERPQVRIAVGIIIGLSDYELHDRPSHEPDGAFDGDVIDERNRFELLVGVGEQLIHRSVARKRKADGLEDRPVHCHEALLDCSARDGEPALVHVHTVTESVESAKNLFLQLLVGVDEFDGNFRLRKVACDGETCLHIQISFNVV